MTVMPGHLKKKICQVCKIYKKLEISGNTFLHLEWKKNGWGPDFKYQ